MPSGLVHNTEWERCRVGHTRMVGYKGHYTASALIGDRVPQRYITSAQRICYCRCISFLFVEPQGREAHVSNHERGSVQHLTARWFVMRGIFCVFFPTPRRGRLPPRRGIFPSPSCQLDSSLYVLRAYSSSTADTIRRIHHACHMREDKPHLRVEVLQPPNEKVRIPPSTVASLTHCDQWAVIRDYLHSSICRAHETTNSPEYSLGLRNGRHRHSVPLLVVPRFGVDHDLSISN